MHCYELFTDRETKACSFTNAAGRHTDLVKLSKNVRLFTCRYSHARIGYLKASQTTFTLHTHADFTLGRSKFDRITQEIRQNLTETCGVCPDGDILIAAKIHAQ